MQINYKNITKEWTKGKKNRKIKRYNFGDKYMYRGNVYIIDNHLIKYSFDEHEDKFAIWLSKRINRQITLIPKIEYLLGIKTPDYRIGNKYFDLKTIHGSSNQIIYHKVRGNERQACNFLINVASDCKLKLNEIIKQISWLFNSNKDDVNWVKIIGIKYDNKLIILKRNSDPRGKSRG